MSVDPQDLGRLRDIVAYGNRVQAMVAGLTPEAFITDTRTFFAVCYGIQVVGEATWKVSDALKRTHPTIPWPLVAGMRHRLVHDYGRTDETIVYQVATIHLPCFIEQIQTILAGLTTDQQPPSA
jgi:uncharacterized protein with HEPN domain